MFNLHRFQGDQIQFRSKFPRRSDSTFIEKGDLIQFTSKFPRRCDSIFIEKGDVFEFTSTGELNQSTFKPTLEIIKTNLHQNLK